MPSFAGVSLSPPERAQLGKPKLLKTRTPHFAPQTRPSSKVSAYSYPPPELWDSVRAFLVDHSLHANPLLDPELTAYTPGETLGLLDHPVITAWHHYLETWTSPPKYSRIILVPCAKTKPWDAEHTSKSKLYTAYNQLRQDRPDLLFVTISEPLGLVPMQHWADFPQYDNPGLFRDDALRSGLTTQQWLDSPFHKKYIIPFDKEARTKVITRLGSIIAGFLTRHQHLPILSLVESPDTTPSTHSEMLTTAIYESQVFLPRSPKRDPNTPRVNPFPYLQKTIGAERVI